MVKREPADIDKVLSLAKEYGLRLQVDEEVIKVCGKYPDDTMPAYEILNEFSMTRPGSVWGLDGVAAWSAEKHGTFCINKSGISKRDAKKLIKGLKAKR